VSPAVRIEVPAGGAASLEGTGLFEGMGDVPFSSTVAADGRLLVWVDRDDLADALSRLGGLGAVGLRTFEEAPRDWVAESAALRKAVAVGRYLLDPHDGALATLPAPGQRRLFLPAARAFGTGSHESTRLALRLLAAEDVRGRRVLDVGCGTGTLAFVASLEGAARAVALDLDVDAALATREQGRTNGVTRVDVFAGPLEALGRWARFDVIVANMIQEELAPLLSGLRKRLVRGGRLLVSGQLVERRGEWEALLRTNGLSPVRSMTENEWLGTASVSSDD